MCGAWCAWWKEPTEDELCEEPISVAPGDIDEVEALLMRWTDDELDTEDPLLGSSPYPGSLELSAIAIALKIR
jgi:hypothetical protein